MPAPRCVEGYSCTASVSCSRQHWLGVREGAEGLSACKLPSWSAESCVAGNLLDGSHGIIMGTAWLPRGLAPIRPGRSRPGPEPYWATVGQASGLGNLSCLDHTKPGVGVGVGGFRCAQRTHVQVTGVSPVNTAAQAQEETDTPPELHRVAGVHTALGHSREITSWSQPRHDGLHAHGTLCMWALVLWCGGGVGCWLVLRHGPRLARQVLCPTPAVDTFPTLMALRLPVISCKVYRLFCSGIPHPPSPVFPH